MNYLAAVNSTLERAIELSNDNHDELGRFASGGGAADTEKQTDKAGNKWGKVADIDQRTKVGSEAHKNIHSNDLQRLAAFRRAHEVGSHDELSAYAKSKGYDHSNQLRTKEMVDYIARKEAENKANHGVTVSKEHAARHVEKYGGAAHPIVNRALGSPVTNIGQLSPDQLKALNTAVKSGALKKTQAGPYPALKTVYHNPSHDAVLQRAKDMASYRTPKTNQHKGAPNQSFVAKSIVKGAFQTVKKTAKNNPQAIKASNENHDEQGRFASNALATLKSGKTIQAKSNSGNQFTIQHKAFAGTHGYGVIPVGKTRVTKAGHVLMSDEDAHAWLSSLNPV